uniref:Uncharacterized protein n=1 Tax=Schizaphis graminum TaxID=13262 RepID=A0A2S2P1F5_SCHGA
MVFGLFLFYIANDIDMKTLPCLTESMIKELIPVISHRARFLSNLEKWKLIIQGSMPSVNGINESSSISIGTDILLVNDISSIPSQNASTESVELPNLSSLS